MGGREVAIDTDGTEPGAPGENGLANLRGPGRKRSRNGPCWCGSGKKYKGCHYDSDQAARALPKLSTILQEIAEPLLDASEEDLGRIRLALMVAAMAWNLSRGGETGADELREQLGPLAETMDELLPPLIKRAQRWPDDPRVVLEVEVAPQPGGYVVNVRSATR